jgi:hypothetical protein
MTATPVLMGVLACLLVLLLVLLLLLQRSRASKTCEDACS